MANSNLEQIGVQTVVQSLDKFVKDMQTYTKQLTAATKETKEYQKTSDKTQGSAKKQNSAFKLLTGGVTKLAKGAKTFFATLVAGIPLLGTLGLSIQGVGTAIKAALGPIGIAIGLVAALGAGIVSLGKRGGEVVAVRTAFGNIISPILEADESIQSFVNNLKQAAGGTVSELDLLKQTNLALAGSTGELRDTFARALPDLLKTAQVQAAATGQSVDYLFQSLVVGIKRGSPLLIDNTGLVLKMSDAYETMAQEMGVSVDQLTEDQKKIAIINATVAAGLDAVAAAGGIQITANTEMARTQAILKDSMDDLAISFEPLAAVILRIINIGLEWVGSIINTIAPYIRWFGEIVRDGFGKIQMVFAAFSNDSSDAMASFGDTFVGQIISVIVPAINFLKDSFFGLAEFLQQAITAYLKFAVNVAAAIGNGLMAGANTFIFPAVIQIATFIADFLAGFSPPKKGPLSTIDQGAANVMAAWTEGFTGAFQPQDIEDVAGQVNSIMGNIADLGLVKVEKRLKQLDIQIRPFVEQVKILKDQFDAMQQATDAGMRAIDRQMERALEGLMKGDKGAEDLVRQLNIQREALQNNLDLEQQRLDFSEIQLAYAKSQQQQERTLLEIQKARLGEQKKQTAQVAKTTKAAKKTTAKAPKLTGKATAPEAAAETKAGGGITPAQAAEVEAFATGIPEGGLENPFAGLMDFGEGLASDFASGLAAGGELGAFQDNIGLLGEQVDRIAASNPVQGIVGAFTDLGPKLGNAAKTAVSKFIGFFTDAEQEGSLAQFIGRINSEGFSAVFGDMSAGVKSWAENTMKPVFDEAVALMLSPFLSPEDPNSLYSRFQAFAADFGSVVGDIGEMLKETIGVWFEDNLITPIRDKINEYFDIFNEEGFFGVFMRLGEYIMIAVGDLLPVITSVFQPIMDWVLGAVEGGGLPQLIVDIAAKVGELPGMLFRALQNVGLIFYTVFLDPFVKMADYLIIEINKVLAAITDSGVVDFLRTIPLFKEIPSNLQIETLSNTINIGQFIPTNVPQIKQARGGILQGPAMVQTGERGRESHLLAPQDAMMTFSNQFVRAMEVISNAILSGNTGGIDVPQPVTNNSSTVNNRNVTLNANTQDGMSPMEIMNQLAIAEALS